MEETKENNYSVYVHINKVNNKMYFGITQENPKIRWNKGYRKGTHFTYAIDKYGWDGFEHIILYDSLTKENACNMEINYIKYYNTTNPKNGYNNSSGGESASGYKWTDEQRQKVSGEKNPFYGKHHSEETKLKLSKSNTGKCTGKDNPMSMSIVCITTDKVFDTIRQASEFYNVNVGDICDCCRGNNKTAGKFNGVRLRWMYYEDYNQQYKAS